MGEQKIATMADIEEIEGGYELADFLETHFLENTIEDGRPETIERMCAFVYAHRGQGRRWTEQSFYETCKEEGHETEIRDLHSALRNLVNANVLSYSREGYAFTFPLLGDILKNMFPDLGTLLQSLK